MLYYKFNNYEGFKALFAKRVCGNGNIQRLNKILLTLIKSKEFLHDQEILSLTDMAQMEQLIYKRISHGSYDIEEPFGCVISLGFRYYSKVYKTDDHNGLCIDGSTDYVRVVKLEDDGRERIVKSKAGKLFRSLALETDFGQKLPAEVLNYLCEQFTLKWRAYSASQVPDVELHIDDNFKDIYDSDCCLGDFGSCMVNEGQHLFYENAVNASAAYLTNANGDIIARAILFNEVWDEDNNKYRYLERQYSCDSNEIYKQLLVNKLIAADKIDIYKQVGAGCRDSRLIVDKNGVSLRNKVFHIKCALYNEDTLSYQDTFKYYDYDSHTAYNASCVYYTDELSTTDSRFYREGKKKRYDEYNDEYTTSDLVPVYYNGREMSCSEDRLDDFYYIENFNGGMYVHDSCLSWCPNCGEAFFSGDYGHCSQGFYSELTDEDYCCESCLEEAERKWKQKNWVKCEDDEYHDPDDCFYSDMLDEWFTCEAAIDEAETKFKSINYDFCEDTQEWEDPDETYYSEILDKFFLYEKNMIEAELKASQQPDADED